MTEPKPIIINGKDYIFHFNNYALSELGKCLGINIVEAPKALMEFAAEDVFLGMAYIVYSGIVGYEKSQLNFKHGIELKYIVQWIGNLDQDELERVGLMFNDFKDSQGITKFMKEIAEKELEAQAKKDAQELAINPNYIPEKKKKQASKK